MAAEPVAPHIVAFLFVASRGSLDSLTVLPGIVLRAAATAILGTTAAEGEERGIGPALAAAALAIAVAQTLSCRLQ